MKNSVFLDHLIVYVNNLEETIAFWSAVFEFVNEGSVGPFQILRIAPNLTFQFMEWPTEGGAHFAFGMDQAQFDTVFQRIKEQGIPFGDSFDTVGNQRGPGMEEGAKGMGKSIYFFDPNKHLLEIRSYD